MKLKTRMRVDENGRVVIPSSFRKRLGIRAGDEVILQIQDDELRITTLKRERLVHPPWFQPTFFNDVSEKFADIAFLPSNHWHAARASPLPPVGRRGHGKRARCLRGSGRRIVSIQGTGKGADIGARGDAMDCAATRGGENAGTARAAGEFRLRKLAEKF